MFLSVFFFSQPRAACHGGGNPRFLRLYVAICVYDRNQPQIETLEWILSEKFSNNLIFDPLEPNMATVRRFFLRLRLYLLTEAKN